METTIEFCTFELAFELSFTLTNKFSIFGPNLAKKDICGKKPKM